jgi:hypothetical protein
MVQAGAALVAIVGGVVGARYVAVHARRHELSYDFARASDDIRGSEGARGECERRIAGRAAQLWVWGEDRVERILGRGRHDEYAILADLDPDLRNRAEREIDSILTAAEKVSDVVADEDSIIHDVVRVAREREVSERAAVASYLVALTGRGAIGMMGLGLIGAVEDQFNTMVHAWRNECERLDTLDREEIAAIEARGDRASDRAQDIHAELLGLARSGEYGVALKVLGTTAIFSVVFPLGVMILRPADSLTLRLVGAGVFLLGLLILARYLLIYARYLSSLKTDVDLPKSFWKLMWKGAVPRTGADAL